jgi:YfiH family protein
MRQHEKNGLIFHSFGNLDKYPLLRHGVFSSQMTGGMPFDLSFPDACEKEFKEKLSLASSALGLPFPYYVKQVHKSEILFLEKDSLDGGMGGFGFDAIIGSYNQSMLIRLADCQGIILYDPVTNALAVVHSGWRGSVLNIIGNTVKGLIQSKKVEPKNLIAAISPSIGPCCMEFKDYRSMLPQWAWIYRRRENFIDFWAMTIDQLKDTGVKEENIELSGICTRCQDGFFSHRRGESGRFGVMAGIIYE